MDNLKHFFSSYHIPSEEITTILSFFKPKNIEKGDYLLKEGNICKHLTFIHKGILEYFTLMDGNERSTYFATEENFVVSLLSYFTETPSRENIRAIQDCELFLIEKKDVNTLLEQFISFKNFYISVLEWQIGCIEKTRLDLLTLNAEQRYEKLIIEEPHLLQQIPLQNLSSLLGVTPRHLSRIRSKIK